MAQAIMGAKFMDEVTAKLKFNENKVNIVNRAFRFFSKFTFAILIVSCGLVTLSQMGGKPIECVTPHKDDIRPDALNQYCFIMSTYTLPHLYNQTVGKAVPYFGVGPHDKESDQETKYHAYYQWVPFVLFGQAIFFYVPYMIWKALEGKKIKNYCNLVIVDNVMFKHRTLIIETGDKGIQNKEQKEKVLGKCAKAFFEYLNYNVFYAYSYIFCEILNFIVVIINIFATDAFLGYEFSSYGPKVVDFLSEDPEDRIDPMSLVFPKVTKCDFHKYGPSGNLVNYDVMCILKMNIMIEKIYVFLWFWFVILAIIGGLALIYRAAVVLCPTCRNMIMEQKLLKDDQDIYRRFSNQLSYPDWFVLKRIAENINKMRLAEFCAGIQKLMHDSPSPELPARSLSFVTTPPPDYDKSKALDEESKQPLFNSKENIYG